MAEFVLRIIEPKRPQMAMSVIGAIVSIPVFCDSGFVILSSLKKAIAKRAKVAVASVSIALATGLYATHTLVPPTPRPIVAAGNIGAENYLGTILKSDGEDDFSLDYEEIVQGFGEMPSTLKSFAPILVPILLIGFSSIINFAEWSGTIFDIFVFLGSPSVALLVGILFAFMLL